MNNSLTFEQPSENDYQIISQGISDENKKSPHMMNVSPEYLKQSVETYGGSALYVQGELAGFIKLIHLGNDIFEWGSLFVLEIFRGQKLSKILISHILETHKTKAMICVTNVEQVKRVCKELEQIEIVRSSISKEILLLIENGQPLLNDDHIFGNEAFCKML